MSSFRKESRYFVLGLGKSCLGDASATAVACNLSCQILLHLP